MNIQFESFLKLGSIIIVLLNVYLTFLYLYQKKSMTALKTGFIFFLWVIIFLSYSYFIFYSFQCAEYDREQFLIHIKNMIAIFISILLLHLIRICLERLEGSKFIKSFKKNLFDSSHNTIGSLVCYSAIMIKDSFLSNAAIMLAILNIIRVLAFRIYDDIYRFNKYSIDKKLNYHPGHVFLRGLFDQIPRIYLYTSFSFTIFHLLLIDNPFYQDTSLVYKFRIENSSGNPFVDFFYFNIVTLSTVGYGDISPISAFAKVICSSEIIFAYIILTSIVILIVSRFQNISNGGINSNQTNAAD